MQLLLGTEKWIFNGKNGVHQSSLTKIVKCMLKHRCFLCLGNGSQCIGKNLCKHEQGIGILLDAETDTTPLEKF